MIVDKWSCEQLDTDMVVANILRFVDAVAVPMSLEDVEKASAVVCRYCEQIYGSSSCCTILLNSYCGVRIY